MHRGPPRPGGPNAATAAAVCPFVNRTPQSLAREERAELLGVHQGAELRKLLGTQLVALTTIETVEQALHERRQLERVERFRDVVDTADVEPPGPVAEFGARSQE